MQLRGVWLIAAVAFALLAAACAGGASAGGDSSATLDITTPADGADCDTEYSIVYGNTFEVADLPPGEHTIEALLRNADHSDAGVTDTVTVTVGSGTADDAGGDSPAPSPSEGTTGGGFGY